MRPSTDTDPIAPKHMFRDTVKLEQHESDTPQHIQNSNEAPNRIKGPYCVKLSCCHTDIITHVAQHAVAITQLATLVLSAMDGSLRLTRTLEL